MRPFDRLHPALQHHIVNTLGWRALRPLQEEAIEPILAGEHVILQAPTAGGKTEAALFPVLSRMLEDGWRGLGVLYVCPIKALLNNLEGRLQHYGRLVGRSAELWHGDIRDSARRTIRADPPDILLTTPESIEVMLVTRRVERGRLFADVRVVIVDELHAFAGDDRGWHLLAVLERVSRLAGRDLQRIGLSATVGNPGELLGWLAGSAGGPRRVVAPPAEAAASVEVGLDFVGTLDNAATVIARLHAGEKRLVFCDSRARVEQLAAGLRGHGVDTYVSHSSLSLDERGRAEGAFAEGRNCVIVATSTLELGIDVGDLDRVIQIDAPATVSAFLQRLGRTGRRPGTKRNCLFLATSDDALIRAAGLIQLWSEGFVEPVVAPPEPFHILAQQIMALTLQQGGLERARWREWVGGMPAFAAMAAPDIDAVIDYMLSRGILFEDGGLLSLGTEGERSFGYKNFLELFSVFTSPPLVTVLHGRSEVGQVHESSFQVRGDETPILLLGGRSWKVSHLDWGRRVAHVEPAGEGGRSRWMGTGQPLSFALCQAMRRVLETGTCPGERSLRARRRLEEVAADVPWLEGDSTALVRHPSGEVRWWTFAGLRANRALGAGLAHLAATPPRSENLWIGLREDAQLPEIEALLEPLRRSPTPLRPPITESAIEGLKFSVCLPVTLAARMLSDRLLDPAGVAWVLTHPRRSVTTGA